MYKLTLEYFNKLKPPKMLTHELTTDILKIGTSKVWNLFDLNVYLESKKINLQRDFVWTETQQEKYMEHFLLMQSGINATVYCPTNSDNGVGQYKVIDGKQRLITINRFLNNKVKVFGAYMDEIHPQILNNQLFQKQNFRVIVDEMSDDQLIYLFYYLNEGGTVQNQIHLNNLLMTIKE